MFYILFKHFPYKALVNFREARPISRLFAEQIITLNVWITGIN